MSSPKIQLLYVTTENPVEAARIGRALVSEKLAACANIFPTMRSIYSWKGELAEEEESVLILKTREENTKACMDRVLGLHSYECPCVLVLDVKTGNGPYLDWLGANVSTLQL